MISYVAAITVSQESLYSYKHHWLPVTDANTSVSVSIAFSRMLRDRHDIQGYIQEKVVVCVDVNSGGDGSVL